MNPWVATNIRFTNNCILGQEKDAGVRVLVGGYLGLVRTEDN